MRLAAIGRPTSSAAKIASDAAPALRPTTDGSGGRVWPVAGRRIASPTSSPPAITASSVSAVGAQSAASAAATARVARSRSGASERVMASTACATTATAASLRPCSQAPPRAWVIAGAARAKSTMATAEGVVNPSQAAAAPR